MSQYKKLNQPVERTQQRAGVGIRNVQQQLKQLAKPVVWRVAVALTMDWTIILAAMICAVNWPTWWVCLASILVIGTRQHALGVLGHEAAHYTVTRHRNVNDAIGMVLCFWPLGGSLVGYRGFHQRHHRHLGTEHDPERHFFQSNEWIIPVKAVAPALRFIKGCLGMQLLDYAKLIRSLLPQTKTEWVGIPIWWACFAWILWVLDSLWLLGLYAIAIPTVFWALIELRGWTEHRGIAETHRYKTHWLFQQILFPHNVWMHYEHHQWCYIPFYNLPKARALDETTPVVQLREVFEFLGETDHEAYARNNGYHLTLDHFSDQVLHCS